ncbi:hypothetical protein M9Y10_025919 [Tritrichomonas musculus]|uniref:UBR-type domain-containing protein n=1 Tax=Tritrichomonas musculus TaxID=1915356 RepID=A0ABR2H8T9_9EUKA
MTYPRPNGNFPNQYGNHFQYPVDGNGNFASQGYQGQGYYQNPPMNQYGGIFAHPNQNTSFYYQHQNFARPPSNPSHHHHSNYQQRPNQNLYYPPASQIPQQIPQQYPQQRYPAPQPQSQNQYPQPPFQQPPQPQNQVPSYHPQNDIQPIDQHQGQKIEQSVTFPPKSSDNSIYVPPELLVPANPLEDESLSLSPLYKPYRSPFSFDIESKQSSSVQNNQDVNDSSFSYAAPPFSFNPNSTACCSFLKYGLQPVQGKFFICQTCTRNISQSLNKGNAHSADISPVTVCENCRNTCHKNHSFELLNPYIPAICHCGSGLIDDCLGPNSNMRCKCQLVPDNVKSCIMSNNPKDNHPLFICQTCSKKFNNNFIVCCACASICHVGHELDSAGFGCICNCNDCKSCKLVDNSMKH